MIGHKLKFKRVDTGKYWVAGDIKEGKYGPQAGMKVTPELKAYLDSVDVGGWLNFSIDGPRDNKPKPQASELDDSINF